MNQLRLFLLLGMTLCITACDRSEPRNTQQAAQPVAADPPDPPPCELVMGWDPWEPYQYEIAGGQVFGLDVDLLTAVASHSDCDIAFRKGSWRELLQLLQDGEIDLLGGATLTPEREAFAWFTEPYRDEQFYLYVSSDRLEELGAMPFEELMAQDLRIGVIEDYLYGDPITAYQDDPESADHFEYSAMAETNISRLLDGAVDGIIEDKFVGASIIRQKNLADSISAHPVPFESSPVRIMVSRASVDEAQFEQLNRSVAELQASGAIDKVLAQYRNP